MNLRQLTDRNALATQLRRDASMHLYELGDLDDFFWPHTTYWAPETEPSTIALIYTGTELPVVIALGREHEQRSVRELLRALDPHLPKRFYTHLLPGCADALSEGDDMRDRTTTIEPHGLHDRMVLVDRTKVDAVDTTRALRLGIPHQAELLTFYRDAYPMNWFDARMLETTAYFGVRDGDALVSVAGVHVVSRDRGVAGLGNIATALAARGRGHARVATAAVCKDLLAGGIDPIGLNVESTNASAIRLYRSLGFEYVGSYEEALVTRIPR